MDIEGIIQKIRTDERIRHKTFDSAAELNWYSKDDAGKTQFLADIEQQISKSVNPVLPSPFDYAKLDSSQKHLLIANIAEKDYLKSKSASNWFRNGLVAIVLGVASYAGGLAIPNLNGTEPQVQSAIQNTRVAADYYAEKHEGSRPVWERSAKQVAEDMADNREFKKRVFCYSGLLAVALGALGLGVAYKKRK